ncbi:ABC transporter substrate-binding protein [Aquabacterium sp. OR-4]|uniref:ABC transporter substrate-binding protein n=1 Tax=Aquabacterium sp. OR-4 TaxID=2978127 RepID=UPI0028C96917|nr:extracellular solute-binding protein [Aquabacterium sp. OR-4]MDT7838882.1 extracellular solute-binding protein [Aquabacterium sp. OR-4]
MNPTPLLRRSALALGLALCGALGATVQAGTLVINTDASDPAPKAAWEYLAKSFMAAHPDVTVKINTFDHEGFKTSLRNFLTAEAPDVVSWYAGNRMAPFVQAGLFEDVSDLWTRDGLHDKLKSAAPSMTLNGKQWGVPYTYYPWGIYYRKDLFAKHGLAMPKTWKELLAVSVKLKAAGITPFAIGTKALWPSGGWFDYLNMRVNGHAFHMALTSGQVPYTDARVVAVFDRWDELVRPGYFLANHAAIDWQDAIPAFVKGEAAMYLMGNFAVDLMKKGGLSEAQLGFMPFPKIADLPQAEDAPTDTAHIPSKSRNKADARRFLAWMARAEVQARMNEILGQLPVNREAARPADTYLKEGFTLLSNAQGLGQFYDRDAPAEMAKAGMEGFQRYMVKPDSRKEVLERLESVRKRVYK